MKPIHNRSSLMRFDDFESAKAFRDATRDLPNKIEVELAVTNLLIEFVQKYGDHMDEVIRRASTGPLKPGIPG